LVERRLLRERWGSWTGNISELLNSEILIPADAGAGDWPGGCGRRGRGSPIRRAPGVRFGAPREGDSSRPGSGGAGAGVGVVAVEEETDGVVVEVGDLAEADAAVGSWR